jgi:hypothetical protein
MRGLAVCRTIVVLAGLCLMARPSVAADGQIRVFSGATFGGGTTIVDPEGAVGKANLAIGASAVFLGEVLGAEVDVADAPGFFESGDAHLVLGSRVTTLTGNVVVAAPHRLTEYSLRPYVVGGAGLMRIRTTTSFSVFDVSSVVPAVDLGAGVVGFLTNRVGVCWELRRFQSVGHNPDSNPGLSFGGDVRLSFWRATMAVTIRY